MLITSIVNLDTNMAMPLTDGYNNNRMVQLSPFDKQTVSVLQDVIITSQVRVLHRLRWKCSSCNGVLSGVDSRNKSPKLYTMSSVLTKIMLKIICFCFFFVDTVYKVVNLSCIMWQSSLAACGHVGVATRASGVLFVARRARAVAAWRVPTESVECY